MTLKDEIHGLVDDLPEDSVMLLKFREALRMNRALDEAILDLRKGRTYYAESFTAKVQERWPRPASE